MTEDITAATSTSVARTDTAACHSCRPLRSIAASVLFACLSCTAHADRTRQIAASGTPIFREVSFSPFDPIVLGEPLPTHAPSMVKVSSGQLAFAQRGFGDADSIYVETDSSRRVRALVFIYPRTKGFDERTASYKELLGSPIRHLMGDSAGGRFEHVAWEDTRTTFELSRFASAELPVRIWSDLHDRAVTSP